MQGYDGDKAKILARLRRVEGQVHAVAQMVEDDVYCIDVLTQISAATSALKAVSVMLVDDHLNHCVRQASIQGRGRRGGRRETVGGREGDFPTGSLISAALARPRDDV